MELSLSKADKDSIDIFPLPIKPWMLSMLGGGGVGGWVVTEEKRCSRVTDLFTPYQPNFLGILKVQYHWEICQFFRIPTQWDVDVIYASAVQ